MNFLSLLLAIAAQQGSPFAPPRASMHYAPDRTCDLLNVSVELDVNAAARTFTGRAVNTLSPLRNGLTEIKLNAGDKLELTRVLVNSAAAKFRRVGRDLWISTPPLQKGKPFRVTIDYRSGEGRTGGFHWIAAREGEPNRVGFWTQGETETNSDWAPTWDYPNDLATSETRTTVPADWSVVGNGVLVGDVKSPDGKRRTLTWRMTQPHATYLLAVVGGPFDIKKDTWRGVDLWYVVPRGMAALIDDSFGHTRDMLEFFSSLLGVKYPWPKYAQNAMYEFGGGMENVSSTTLGEGGLTEKREGYYRADSVNSHELAHQWFGDYVTCKDWGDIWLNESFATFMQCLYFEHSRGKNAYDWEIEDATRSYLREARRYKRPISTKMYASGDAMFDSHSYPKGGVVLHTLRKRLGDEAFYSGLNKYLKTHAETPVQTAQLSRALTESCGINVEPFFQQWILSPGHPVLDSTWSYDEQAHEVLMTVHQNQDTSDGTPLYEIDTQVALFSSAGAMGRVDVHLSGKEQTLHLPSPSKPAAVLLDPDHAFLREVPTLHWAPEELPVILAGAPCGVDREAAMRMMLQGSPSDEAVRQIANEARRETERFPPIRTLRPLAETARPELRTLWLALLDHPNLDRQAEAVDALGRLPQDPATTQRLRSLIHAHAPIQVVVKAIEALAKWDAKAHSDVFRAAQKIPSRGDRIKRAANSALGAG